MWSVEVWIAAWGGMTKGRLGRVGGADMACDGDVDWNDLRELVAWWLAGL